MSFEFWALYWQVIWRKKILKSIWIDKALILIMTSEIYNIVILIHSKNMLIVILPTPEISRTFNYRDRFRLDWIESGMVWSPLCSNIYGMSCEFDERRSFLVEHDQLANLGFVLAVHLQVIVWPWWTDVLEYGLCATYQQLANI